MTTTETTEDTELRDVLFESGIPCWDLPLDLPEAAVRDDRWVSVMLRSVKQMTVERDRIRDLRAAHVEQATIEANAFKERAFEVLEREIGNRIAVLESWALDRRSATGAATYQFPAGVIRTREAVQWSWPTDTTAIVNQLAGREDLLRTRVELDKDAIKSAAMIKDDAVLIDGEVLDGVTRVDTITAKVSFS